MFKANSATASAQCGLSAQDVAPRGRPCQGPTTAAPRRWILTTQLIRNTRALTNGSGSLSLQVSGSGGKALTLSNSGGNTYKGGTTVNFGIDAAGRRGIIQNLSKGSVRITFGTLSANDIQNFSGGTIKANGGAMNGAISNAGGVLAS